MVATTRIPAVLATLIPFGASSRTTHSSCKRPILYVVFKNISDTGLPLAISSPENNTSNYLAKTKRPITASVIRHAGKTK